MEFLNTFMVSVVCIVSLPWDMVMLKIGSLIVGCV